jgi:SecD/SecF fusion protein
MESFSEFAGLLGQSSAAMDLLRGMLDVLRYVAIAAAVIVPPALLGYALARWMRMPDHGWRLALVLVSLAVAGVMVGMGELRLDIDLKGGMVLIYELDTERTKTTLRTLDGGEAGADQIEVTSQVVNELVGALGRRLDPGGVMQLVVRRYGSDQVEIIIPDVKTEAERQHIQDLITKSGFLEFRIVANTTDHAHIIEAARRSRSTLVADEAGNRIGEWVRVGRDRPQGPAGQRERAPYKLDVTTFTLRDADTREAISPIPPQVLKAMGDAPDSEAARLTAMTRAFEEAGHRELEVLMALDPYNVRGTDLATSSSFFDAKDGWAVRFVFTATGSVKFASLTGANLPDKQANFYRLLGIVMDKELISAPRLLEAISGEGRITGNFTPQEVKTLAEVLTSGRLPAVLNPNPISRQNISALLGQDTIRKGTVSMLVSLVAVLAFMVVYYRFAGAVATMALAANLLFTIALMILIKARLSLPGLAGLVLTVGMSVDANVLIYERMREEIARGAALRMAIRNGFGKAMSTIVDANITTLITAIVLYVIGTDQIRGFSVTLILGILTSMFTAIFCARVVFDIAERKRWISQLNMMQFIGRTTYDFMGMAKPAIVVSLVLIAAGIAATVFRGKDILDIDFLGGTSVQMIFKEPQRIDNIRAKAVAQWPNATAYEMNVDKLENRVFKVDTPVTDDQLDDERAKDPTLHKHPDGSDITAVELVENLLENELYKGQLVTYELTYSPPELVAAAPDPGLGPPNRPTIGDGARLWPARPILEALRGGHLLALADDAVPTAGAAAPPASGDDAAPAAPPPADGPPAADPSAAPPAAGSPMAEPGATPPAAAPRGPPKFVQSTSRLSFGPTTIDPELREEIYRMKEDSLKTLLRDAARRQNISDLEVQFKSLGPNAGASTEWLATLGVEPAAADALLKQVQDDLASTPVWPSSSNIGGKVAGDMQNLAMAAIFSSCFFIIAYIWIRFQKLVYGLAAVVALVHDVLIMLGAIAVSHWLSGPLGFLLVEDFKINLTVVAAFLTIMGYSLNDTIVVFDRIREVRGKNPDLTVDMINVSVNQTLARSILTSFTVFLVVVILYFMGGSAIHAFAFALVIGVIAGSYSSVFIAAPLLVWIASPQRKAAAAMRKVAAG